MLYRTRAFTHRLETRFVLLGCAMSVPILSMFALPLVPAHARTLLPEATTYNVLGKPTISASFINSVLSAYNSPTAGKGQALYDDGVDYGIDPVFALAFFFHESTFGKAGIATKTRSLGNIRCTRDWHGRCYHGFRSYKTWEEGFKDWYRLLRDLYVRHWHLMTVDKIIPRYAPASDGNDVKGYIKAVKHAVDTWRTGDIVV